MTCKKTRKRSILVSMQIKCILKLPMAFKCTTNSGKALTRKINEKRHILAPNPLFSKSLILSLCWRKCTRSTLRGGVGKRGHVTILKWY